MTQHTSGPWEYEAEHSTRVLVTAGNKTLAFVKSDAATFCEAMRTARLMAAAPDLLEALKQAKLIIESMGPLDGAGELAMVYIKATIVKAEGR